MGLSPLIDDPIAAAGYDYMIDASQAFYPIGTADYDQKRNQVVLNARTADWLYRRPDPADYVCPAEARPVLHRIGERLRLDQLDEAERVRAILQYCYDGFRDDFPMPFGDEVYVLNAREEEVLKLGGGQCEDRARVICCLCQVAGLPARIVASYPCIDASQNYELQGGHALNEIYLQGRWAMFDSLVDLQFIRPDGVLAHTWDLMKDASLVDIQPCLHVARADLPVTHRTYYHQNIAGPRVITLAPYRATWVDRYDWRWISATDPQIQARLARRLDEAKRIVREKVEYS